MGPTPGATANGDDPPPAPSLAAALIEQARRHLDQGELQQAHAVAESALRASRVDPDAADHAESLLLVGQCCRLLAQHPRALDLLTQAEAAFDAQGRAARRAECLMQRGHVHLGVGDFGTALLRFEEALAAAGDAPEPAVTARVLRCLAMASARLNDLAAARGWYEQALALDRRAGDRRATAANLNSLAVLQCRQAEALESGSAAQRDAVGQALPLFDEAIVLAQQAGDRVLLAQTHANLGHAYALLGDHARLIDSETRSLEIFRAEGARQDELQSLTTLGAAHGALGHDGPALALLDEASRLAAELGLKPAQASAAFELSRLHERAGRTAEALQCFKRFHELERQLQDDSARRQALQLAARREVERAQREIAAQRRRADELDRMAFEDVLTGIANRRRLEQWLDDPAAHASGCSIAVADVDHFKSINDRYSHAVGDRVLSAIGAILRRHHRAGDLVARWGGEEFVLVFTGTPLAAARAACERIRQAIEQHDWAALEPGLAVTLSLGVAHGLRGGDVRALLREADGLLLEAKRSGRNRTVAAGDLSA